MRKRNIAAAFGLVLSLTGMAAYAVADGIADPSRFDYFKVFAGKTIAFVPVSMGIDLTEGWAAVMKRQADKLGMKLEVRDAHFSADAGAQALTSLISEKPDIIVVHNPDVQSYAKLLKRAEEAGIHVIQINMRSNYNSDVYVGADWIGIGEAEAQGVIDKCGAGTSGKVAVLQGQPTSGSDRRMMKGVENAFSKHPEIKTVANVAGEWDATKAPFLSSHTPVRVSHIISFDVLWVWYVVKDIRNVFDRRWRLICLACSRHRDSRNRPEGKVVATDLMSRIDGYCSLGQGG